MTYIESELKELFKTNTGWVSPDGNLIICNAYDHKRVIINLLNGSKTPIGKVFTQWYKDRLEYLSDIEESCAKEYEESGGGWHSYDMANDSFENDIIEFAYYKGFLRLRIDSYNSILFVEGSERGLEINRSIIKELTDSISCSLGKEFSLETEKARISPWDCWK